jgi:hypothetical protein
MGLGNTVAQGVELRRALLSMETALDDIGEAFPRFLPRYARSRA